MTPGSKDLRGILEAGSREHAKPCLAQDRLRIHPDQGIVIGDESVASKGIQHV